MNALQEALVVFQNSSLPLELLGLLASVVLAWVCAWAIGRGGTRDSILFGRRVVDGLLFPLLALVFTLASKTILAKFQSVELLKLAVPVLLALAVIRLIARVLTSVFPESHGARLIERAVSWLAWAFAVMWITGLLQPMREELGAIELSVGKSHVSLLHVVEVFLSSSFVLVLTLWLSAFLETKVMSRALTDLSMRKVASNAMRAFLLLIGMLVALSVSGVDLTALSVLGGALGVGLGFGLQKLAANYVSGFVILLERSLRIGDYVRVDSFEGWVTDIKTRYTLVRAINGVESVIPNELLMTQRVENLSLESSHLLQNCMFWVGLHSNVEQVQKLLVDAAMSADLVIADPAPMAMLAEVVPQGLRFQLNFWMDDPTHGQGLVKSNVNIAALEALRKAGVLLAPAPYEVQLVKTV
ncbi:MAG: mechanosensitive ion channel [Burkholderiales bacterium]|nr:mechanosensitive ion channel [Burkholderiales bacterium]